MKSSYLKFSKKNGSASLSFQFSWVVSSVLPFLILVLMSFDAPATSSVPTKSPTPQAVTNLYQIDNIKVDVTAASSQAARNQAIVEAQRKASEQILVRLLPEIERAKFAHLSDEEIDFMVQDFEIVHEKLSKVRYIGTFTIRFNPTAVDKVLSGSGAKVQPQVVVIPEMLVLPIYQDGGQSLLWEEKNVWFAAWTHKPFENQTFKIILPVGDLADISDLSTQDALAGHNAKMAKLIRRYNAQRAMVAILKKQNHEYALELRPYALEGMLATSGDIVLPAEAGSEQSIFAALLKTEQLLPQLEQEFKAGTQSQKKIIKAEFQDIKEWLEIKKVLQAAPNIRNFSVTSLKTKEAYISFQQVGAATLFDEYLKTNGFAIHEAKDKISVLQRVANTLPSNSTDILPNQSASTGATEGGATGRNSPYYMPSEVLPQTTAPLTINPTGVSQEVAR